MVFASAWGAELYRSTLETDPAVIYALDQELRIVYCNEAWDRFSAANGGRGLQRDRQVGCSVVETIPLALRPYFIKNYQSVLATGQPWEHSYECSSPTLFRQFRMMACPDLASKGIVVVNSLWVERAHDPAERSDRVADDYLYRREDGLITMCCHCRRTSRTGNSRWDWVADYLRRPPHNVTHGICEVCVNLYYPDYSRASDYSRG
jgi:hypothetical protein